ncbi:MAG: hypothetical protein WCB31_02200 [Nitrososphaeraceae archaeon]
MNHRIYKKINNIEKDIKKKEENPELEWQHLLNKFGNPIIYQDKNQKTIRSSDVEDVNVTQDKKEIKTVREIANYYIKLHMDMISTYNSVYSNLLQEIFDSSLDCFPIHKRVTHCMFDDTNRYASLISDTGNTQKFLDDIMTKNMSTFIKSLEITQKFYQDIIQSCLDCVKK